MNAADTRADDWPRRDGALWVKGLARRNPQRDGRFAACFEYGHSASDAVALKVHTGHALHLRCGGVVPGTAGNRFDALSSHGLGDNADRCEPIFGGAPAIAAGSRHALAIRQYGRL